jgi:hypothetical protein
VSRSNPPSSCLQQFLFVFFLFLFASCNDSRFLTLLLPISQFSYLSRNVALDGIGKLALAIGTEAAVISLASLQKGTSDKVPNVRFNAIKALRFVAPLLPPQDVSSTVLPLLKNLSSTDSDVDVRPTFDQF